MVVLFLCNDVDRNNIKIGGYLLRKKIFIIIMVLLLSLQTVCSAAELSQYLDGRAVNVTEDEDSIDIYALVSFVGDEKDDYVPNTSITYSEAFMIGVKYVWSGVYDGKRVNVHIEEVEDNTPVQKVRVLFDSVPDNITSAMLRKRRLPYGCTQETDARELITCMTITGYFMYQDTSSVIFSDWATPMPTIMRKSRSI